MEKFSLFHVVLYAKDWYKRYDNDNTIIDDLKVMLTLDGYSGHLMSKQNVLSIILNNCQLLNLRAFTDLLVFASGIDKGDSWKHGYSYKGMPFTNEADENLPEWDYHTAIIHYCLSNLSISETTQLVGEGGCLPMPDYENGLKRPKDVSNKMLEDFFGNQVERIIE